MSGSAQRQRDAAGLQIPAGLAHGRFARHGPSLGRPHGASAGRVRGAHRAPARIASATRTASAFVSSTPSLSTTMWVNGPRLSSALMDYQKRAVLVIGDQTPLHRYSAALVLPLRHDIHYLCSPLTAPDPVWGRSPTVGRPVIDSAECGRTAATGCCCAATFSRIPMWITCAPASARDPELAG